jgi:hypothetical protein
MKKKIFISFAALAVAAVAAWNVYLASAQSNNEMSDLMLANVEALARGEPGSGITVCETKWTDCSDPPVDCGYFEKVNFTETVYSCVYGDRGSCDEGWTFIKSDCYGNILEQQGPNTLNKVYCN